MRLISLESVLGYIAYQAWAIAAGAFWFYSRLGQSGSSEPDVLLGKTAGLNDHGEWLYVYPWQKALFHGALYAGLVVFALVVLVMQTRLGKVALTKIRPLSLTAAIVVAAVGWMTIVQLSGM